MESKHLALGLSALCLLSSALRAASPPDGYVVKSDTAAIYLDWGKSSGAAPGDQFKVYRDGEVLKHPVTGEILGKSETPVGVGVIQRMEDKYSIGSLLGISNSAKPGDRTHWISTGTYTDLQKAAVVQVVPVAQTLNSGPVMPVPKEIWKGAPLKAEGAGLAIGDLLGDGKKEVVLASHGQVEVFRWNGTALESVAVFNPKSFGNFLTVETGDVDGIGHDKIFASYYIEGIKRSRTTVLELSQGKLQEVGRFDGFARALEHADGKRVVMVQDVSMSRDLRVRSPAPLIKKDGKYKTGDPVKFSPALGSDQLFGYTYGDWDGDGSEDFAYLQYGERLRVFLKDKKWGSNDTLGGSKADFNWEDDQLGSVFPRLLNIKTAGKMQLLVPHNISASPIRFARLKIFREAELLDMAWNGLEMTPVWKIPVFGLLADFALGDVTGSGSPQIWTAAVNGNQTVLAGYSLP